MPQMIHQRSFRDEHHIAVRTRVFDCVLLSLVENQAMEAISHETTFLAHEGAFFWSLYHLNLLPRTHSQNPAFGNNRWVSVVLLHVELMSLFVSQKI